MSFSIARKPFYPLSFSPMTDDTTPATKADLERLGDATKADIQRLGDATKADIGAMKADIGAMKADIGAMKADVSAVKIDIQRVESTLKTDIQQLAALMDMRFTRVNDSIDTVLDVLVNMKNQLAPEVKDHKKRITRLERHVGIVA